MKRWTGVRFGGVVVIGALFAGAALLHSATAQLREREGASASPRITFTGLIGPILRTHCVSCHSPGGIAPFSLTTYPEAQSRAGAIAGATNLRAMPPWKPEPGKGRFLGERRLTDDEIRQIAEWAANGAPEGNPADLPPPPPPLHAWRLGTPDLIVTMPVPYDLDAGTDDVFRTFVIPIPLSEPRYVRAVEFEPGQAHVVHHANLGIDRSGSARRLDLRDPEPGYAGGMVPDAGPEGQLLGWTPGQTPREVPPGLSWRLEPGSDFVAQLHLRPSGHAEKVRARVGFFFTDQPPTRTAVGLRLGSQTIDIPSGAREHVVTDTYVLPVDVEVTAILPHAHYLARTMEAYAERPDDSKEWLISIRDWDFNWQDIYRYTEPVPLPRGTRIVMRFTYDNSSRNARNPNRPPKRVVWGQRTTDEMGDLWLQVVPTTAADAAVLTADFARKAYADDVAAYDTLVRADPLNPLRRDILGGLYLQAGRLDAAIEQFQISLALNPESAPTRYNLGLALSRLGRSAEAVTAFEEAIRIDPEHGEAHNNLGVVLYALGRHDDALARVRRGADIRPNNPNARSNVGQMLSAMGREGEAVEAFQRALVADPSWIPALNGLAWVRATARDPHLRSPDEAIALAERAAAATASADPVVLNILAAAYAAANRFEDAAAKARAAADLAAAQQKPALEVEIRRRLASYAEQQLNRSERRH